VLRPHILRFEIDRSLTGMGHESYLTSGDVTGDRPPDLLAERLFGTGDVTSVHVFSNIVTVSTRDAAPATDDRIAALEDVLRGLFIHYRPGIVPTAV
jgi:hypothetical protein